MKDNDVYQFYQPFDVDTYLIDYANAFGGTVNDGAGPPMDFAIPNADGAFRGNPAVSGYLFPPLRPAEPNE